MNKTWKLLSVFVLLFCLIVFSSCEELKQIISDTLEVEIEEKVNEILKDTCEGKFELPAAKRYEGFSISSNESETTYKIDIIEPSVTFEEYATNLKNTLGKDFLEVEIPEVTNGENEWEYTYENITYKVNFLQLEDKWQLKFVVVDNSITEDVTETQ